MARRRRVHSAMTKKNRAKSKAKRFGEGSARPIVEASTYGVGNAFADLGPAATPVPPRGARAGMKELLVVDGYNVIHATPKYEKLMFDRGDHPYSSDVYERARTALIGDVAAFAGRQYDAVVVFDAAGNVSPDRPNLPQGGVRVVFSPTGVTADTVIQDLCTEAREQGRACSVVTSDAMIQATVMGKGVARISSRMLVDEIEEMSRDFERTRDELVDIKLTLGSRLSPESLAKLKAIRGR